jgi:hypothetical protein
LVCRSACSSLPSTATTSGWWLSPAPPSVCWEARVNFWVCRRCARASVTPRGLTHEDAAILQRTGMAQSSERLACYEATKPTPHDRALIPNPAVSKSLTRSVGADNAHIAGHHHIILASLIISVLSVLLRRGVGTGQGHHSMPFFARRFESDVTWASECANTTPGSPFRSAAILAMASIFAAPLMMCRARPSRVAPDPLRQRRSAKRTA